MFAKLKVTFGSIECLKLFLVSSQDLQFFKASVETRIKFSLFMSFHFYFVFIQLNYFEYR